MPPLTADDHAAGAKMPASIAGSCSCSSCDAHVHGLPVPRVIGIIVAVGLVVVLASAIVVVMSSRRSRHKADHSKPGPYSTAQPIPPAVGGGGFAASHVDNPNSRGTLTTGSTATSTSLVVDFGETYHEKTMHTHL
jgi:hypothetical protein